MSMPGLDLYPVRQYEPVEDHEGKRYFYFGAALSVDMSRDFADAIFAAIEGSELFQYEGVYVEAGGEDYDELVWYPARVLKTLVAHPQIERSQTNRAAWAYLAVLDDDDPVGVHWAF